MSNNNLTFDSDVFCDYVLSHGYGEPTQEGYIKGRVIFDQCRNYAITASDIVTLGLTKNSD